MISNINYETFKNYGEIIHEGFQYACSNENIDSSIVQEKVIKSKNITMLQNIENRNIIMDILNGIALLCVSTNKNCSDIKIFLLDKTISIKPGIYYEVIALYGSCEIRYAVKSPFTKETIMLSENITPITIYPKVEIDKIHTLFYQEKEFGFKFKGEKHNFWELTYVDKGLLYMTIDGKKYQLNQGELIFYGNNQFHTQWAEKNASVCFITITFDIDIMDKSILLNKIFTIDNDLKKLLKMILSERRNHNHYSNDLILCYLKEFIIKLIRYEKFEYTLHNLNTDIQENVENSIIENTIDYIKSHIDTKITIPRIAQSIPISPSYLSTIFKKHMNVTLGEYINNYKLEKSKDLIRTGKYNITQVSNLLGYNSVHYFSRQFKDKYGISPSTYSKSIQD